VLARQGFFNGVGWPSASSLGVVRLYWSDAV
jgi:hypothetical protein